jgi:hypothetical protein
MTLKELLRGLVYDRILDEIEAAYPDATGSREGHAEVLKTLFTMEPAESAEMAIIIAREPADPPMSDEPWWHVFGRKDGEATRWGLDFTPWAEWLAMEVRVENCDLTPEQIAAHCLWEMTFHGYVEEEVLERGAALKEECDKTKALLDELGDNPTDEQLEAIGLHLFRAEDFVDEDEDGEE